MYIYENGRRVIIERAALKRRGHQRASVVHLPKFWQIFVALVGKVMKTIFISYGFKIERRWLGEQIDEGKNKQKHEKAAVEYHLLQKQRNKSFSTVHTYN